MKCSLSLSALFCVICGQVQIRLRLAALCLFAAILCFCPHVFTSLCPQNTQMDADEVFFFPLGVKPYFCMIWGLPAQFLRQNYE
jgi:hypothetical protein